MKAIDILKNANYQDTVYYMIKLIEGGSKNVLVRDIAKKAISRNNTLNYIFNECYNSAVYFPDKEDHQQPAPAYVTLRDKRANCVNYSILIGSILYSLGKPFEIKLVDFSKNFEAYKHVYIVCDGFAMDCVLGQKQDGTESFEKRNKFGMFGVEVKHTHSKTYKIVPKLSILQGTNSDIIVTNGFARNKIARLGLNNQSQLQGFSFSDIGNSISSGLSNLDPTNPSGTVGKTLLSLDPTIKDGTLLTTLANIDPSNPSGAVGNLFSTIEEKLPNFDPTNKNTWIGGLVDKTLNTVLKTNPKQQKKDINIIPVIGVIAGAGLLFYLYSND